MIRRTPTVSLAAILSLALGIGANTAIVSLIDIVLWRDLPVPAPKQLSLVHWSGFDFPRELADGASGDMQRVGGRDVADFFSYPASRALRDAAAPTASLAAFGYSDNVSVSFEGRPTVAQQRPVDGNFFSTLQVRPFRGRTFYDSDNSPAAPATVIVSHRFWVSALASDPAIIGKTIRVNNKPEIVVGVLPPAFYGLIPGDATELYTPFPFWQNMPGGDGALTNNRLWCVQLLARSPLGANDLRLQSILNARFRATWSRQPRNPSTAPVIQLDNGDRGLDFLSDELRDPLLILGGLVALLLVIACANIVNLLLARAVARHREVTVRVALGCSRSRLIRQFITESTLLALLGGIASIGIGFATANFLGRFLAPRDGLPIAVALDLHVFATVGVITAVALLLFGLAPAFLGSKLSATTWGRAGLGARSHGSSVTWSLGRMLVIAQMAMSVLLVLTAIVFTRNLLVIQSADPGFDRRNLVMFGIRPGTSGYDKAALPAFYAKAQRLLAEAPGVVGVGMASMRPMNVGGWWEEVALSGQTGVASVSVNGITPGYLPLFVPRMIAGRNFTRTDITAGAKVTIISEDLARKLGGGSLLGRLISFTDGAPGEPPRRFQIIGIAPSFAATSLKVRPYVMWLPIGADNPEVTIVVRTAEHPQNVLPALRRTMANIDRNLPLVDVMTMEQQIGIGLQRERMFASLCTGFGVLALILSVVGLYGVVAYSTSRRRSEIGVRLALGALPRNVLGMILREGLSLVVLGVLIAAPVAWLGTRYITKLLQDMKPLDPLSFVGALVVLMTAALIAITIPAIRAAAVDPADTLRQE
jgi:predicted permease